MPGVTDELEDFEAIDVDWSGILIGNGTSLAISNCFEYRSLFEQAKTTDTPINQSDISIFEHLKTKNFEQVLSALNQAKAINRVFDLEHDEIIQAYSRIQNALAEAVHGVHVKWDSLDEKNLSSIREGLLDYDFVYSTNYDLLLYWAINQNSSGFKDFFWGNNFDLGNTEIWGKATKVLFLHGGLHLYKTSRGTLKRKARPFENLLDLFGTPVDDDENAVPLFVTEGASSDKLKSIYNNDYLSFAYNRFANHHGPIIILGQSLDENFDKHLLDALRASTNRYIGIGIHRGSKDSTELVHEKTKFLTKFVGFDVRFFDASTHPLGNPSLSIDQPTMVNL